MDERIIKIQHVLKKELDDNRYQHTLGVMYTAASMAMRYDVDVLKALYAGLLHDCAKCIPNDKKLHLCGKYGFTVSDIERENPSLLHAKLGACLAHEKYGVTDKEIIHAIESHTTGCPAMTMLEKIMYRILKDSLVYLNSRKIAVDPMTQKTYDYYKKEMGKED